MLFGHELAPLFGFGAFYLVSDERPPSSARLASAGLLVGAAAATEYTAAIVVPLIGLYLLWRVRARVAWYLLGGVPSAVLLGWYHSVVFGSALSHPYRWSVFGPASASAPAPFDERPLSPFLDFRIDQVVDVFVSGRGFAVATPLVVVALYGLVVLIRGDSGWHKSVGLATLGIFLAFLLLPGFWSNPWGGDSPGARYMTPALPFLIVGVVAAWPRIRRLAGPTAVVGAVTMLLATLTDPILSRNDTGGIGIWIGMLFDNGPTPTVFTIAVGPLGWLIHVALAAAAVYLLRQAWLTDPSRLEAEQSRVVEMEPA